MRWILKLPLAVAHCPRPASLGTDRHRPGAVDAARHTQIIETADSRKACDNPLIEHPFTQFGDNLDYVLAPGGKFDGSVSGWQLAGGAKVIATDKGRSLQLPKGASAISPSMCLDLNFPTFRMYHKVVKPKTGLVGGLLGGVLGLVLGSPERRRRPRRGRLPRGRHPDVDQDDGVRRRRGRVGRQRLEALRPDRPEAGAGRRPCRAPARPRCASRSSTPRARRASSSTTSTSTRCAGKSPSP